MSEEKTRDMRRNMSLAVDIMNIGDAFEGFQNRNKIVGMQGKVECDLASTLMNFINGVILESESYCALFSAAGKHKEALHYDGGAMAARDIRCFLEKFLDFQRISEEKDL